MTRKELAFILWLIVVLGSGCSQPGFDERVWRQEVESQKISRLYDDHYRDGEYFNPWVDVTKPFSDLLRWRFSEKQPYTEQETTYLPDIRTDTMERIRAMKQSDFIIWIGHDSFLIKTGEQVWLTDPMFSKRALLPARKTPPGMTAQQINDLFPKVNVIISHNHYDHLDEESIRDLSGAYVYYVPVGLAETLRDWQPDARIVEMDWWQQRTLEKGYELHCLPAQHWSRRAFDGENTSLWASFMVISPNLTVYFGGDSGYFMGYREIGRKYSRIDYALIPTTAYHPRWFMHKSHMNIEEAILAFEELGAGIFIPTQWGTFHLGDEPVGYPILDLKRTIKARNLDRARFLILDIGELAEL